MDVVIRNVTDCPANLLGKSGVIEHIIVETSAGASGDIAYDKVNHEDFIIGLMSKDNGANSFVQPADGRVKELRYSVFFKVRIDNQIFILPPVSLFPSKNVCLEKVTEYMETLNRNNCRSIW